MTADFLRGVMPGPLEATLVHQALVELRLLKIGIPYYEIQTMSKPEIDLLMGAYTALEEKQSDDQEAATRSANARPKIRRPMR